MLLSSNVSNGVGIKSLGSSINKYPLLWLVLLEYKIICLSYITGDYINPLKSAA